MVQRQSLRNDTADRNTAYHGFADFQSIEQSGNVVREILSGIRRWNGIGQPVAALIVANHAEIRGQSGRHLIPNTQVAAQRIGKNDSRLFLRALIDVTMDNVVKLDKWHGLGFKVSEPANQSQLCSGSTPL